MSEESYPPELDTLYSLINAQRLWLRQNTPGKTALQGELTKLQAAAEYLEKITAHRVAIEAILNQEQEGA